MWMMRAMLLLLLTSPAVRATDDGIEHPWKLDLDWITDEYSGIRGGEQSASTQLGYRFSKGAFGYVRYDWMHHYDAYDQSYHVGAVIQPIDALLVAVEGGGAPANPVFTPDKDGLVRVDLVQWDLIQPSIAYRYLDYDEFGHVSIVTPGITILTPAGNVEFRDAFSREVDGSHTSTRSLKLFRAFGEADQYAVYLAGFDGEDALPPQIRADFYRIMVGGAWIMSRVWEVRADYGWEHREDFYIDRSFALGITRRF